MPTWTEVRLEMDKAARAGDTHAQDTVRRHKLADLERLTERPLVVYATDFTNPSKARDAAADVSITTYDKDGWIEVTDDLPDGPLDVMLHSPGGSPFMAEWIVSMLRCRFDPIRVLVPHSAKSAAAMIALSADEILMDDSGELGPIDPQMVFVRDQQTVASPAQAILEQFERAQSDIAENPDRLPAWIPILRQYGPSLLEECKNALALSQQLVATWLEAYMFRGEQDAQEKAGSLAAWVGNHNNFKAHPRQITDVDLRQRGVKVLDLRTNVPLRDAIWAVWSAYRITFDATGCYKIFENSRGDAFVRSVETRLIPIAGTPAPAIADAPPGPPPSRAERRRQKHNH